MAAMHETSARAFFAFDGHHPRNPRLDAEFVNASGAAVEPKVV